MTSNDKPPVDDLRTHIRETAAELFAQEGYEVSMRKLARHIGYTATTIYHHFENKDALVFAVVEESFETFRVQLAAARDEHEHPRDQLHAMGEAYVRFAVTHPHHYRLMFVQRPEFLAAEELPGCDALPQPGHPRMRAFDVLLDVVARGLQLPRDHERSRSMADAIWSCVHGVSMLHLAMPDEFDDARTEAALAAIDELLTFVL